MSMSSRPPSIQNSQEDLKQLEASALELKTKEQAEQEKEELLRKLKEAEEKAARLEKEAQEKTEKEEARRKRREENRLKKQEERELKAQQKQEHERSVELNETPRSKSKYRKVKFGTDGEQGEGFDLLHQKFGEEQESQLKKYQEKQTASQKGEDEEEIKEEDKIVRSASDLNPDGNQGQDDEIQSSDDELKYQDAPVLTYNIGQKGAWQVREFMFANTVTVVADTLVNPLIPQELAPLRIMFDAGVYTAAIHIHNTLHTLLKEKEVLRHLERHGNALRGLGHEAAKFAISEGVTVGLGVGTGYALVAINHAAPGFTGSTVGSIVTNGPAMAAIVHVGASLLKNGVRFGYDRIKGTPAIGPEEVGKAASTTYYQEFAYQLSRLGIDATVYNAITMLMSNYGLGVVLIAQPEIAIMVTLAVDQLILEPSRYLGHQHKPMESLVAKPEPETEGYESINQDESSQELGLPTTLKPSNSQIVGKVGLRAVGVGVVLATGYGLILASQKIMESMGYKEEELTEGQRQAQFVAVGASTIVLERTLVTFGAPVANKAMEGARYIGGALQKCGSGMFSAMSSIKCPSLPSFGRSAKVTNIEEVQESNHSPSISRSST